MGSASGLAGRLNQDGGKKKSHSESIYGDIIIYGEKHPYERNIIPAIKKHSLYLKKYMCLKFQSDSSFHLIDNENFIRKRLKG